MSGKNYLLDTNIVINLFANQSTVVERIRSQSANFFIPSIVIGELFYGAYQSTRKDDNVRRVESFARASIVLDCDLLTARYYGQVKSALKSKGTPIPENDVWIAAIAYQYQLTLVTRDKHFTHVDTINIENW